jgi:hypothetical protein
MAVGLIRNADFIFSSRAEFVEFLHFFLGGGGITIIIINNILLKILLFRVVFWAGGVGDEGGGDFIW